MGKRENNIIERRLVHSYLSSIISISLVLLLVGIFGMLAVNVRQFSNYFKENVMVSVILGEKVSEEDGLKLKDKILKLEQVKDVKYISKEQGTMEMQDMLGEDFLAVFETNPVPISMEVSLKGDYFSTDRIEEFKALVEDCEEVGEVVYKASLVEMINENIEKIGLAFTVFVVLLLFVSFVLINNTVRLNVFHKRFSIYTMKLVGATRAFIRAPFLVNAVFQGMLSGLVADLGLLGIMFVVRNEFEQLFTIFNVEFLAVVLLSVMLLGVIICVVCTYFVINRLVGLSMDELYY